MSLRQLSLTDFRNLKSCTLELNPHLNLIRGSNASGKTSFLESINILCQGRSFRTTRLDECIQHDTDSFMLFGNFIDHKAGISKKNNEVKIRINGESVQRLSSLAELTPVNIINPDSFDLIKGTPGRKREYIDWCLFHVEPSYHHIWTQFSHALKQRNALLRSRKDLTQLDYWDDHLCQHSLKVYVYRQKYLQILSDIITNELTDLIDDLDVIFDYVPGWSSEKELINVYKNNRSKDIKYGFTQHGVHRDNIEITSHQISVQRELSRGQQKRLSIAMVVAQIILIKRITNKQVILLLDDIHSELDEDSTNLVMNTLTKLNIQLFISFINSYDTLSLSSQEYKMFHVEHGMIRTVKNT